MGSQVVSKHLSVPRALALMKAAPTLLQELRELSGEACVLHCPVERHLTDCIRRSALLAQHDAFEDDTEIK